MRFLKSLVVVTYGAEGFADLPLENQIHNGVPEVKKAETIETANSTTFPAMDGCIAARKIAICDNVALERRWSTELVAGMLHTLHKMMM